MSINLISVENSDFPRGHVIVVQHGEVVANGRLTDLVMIDDGNFYRVMQMPTPNEEA